MSLTELLILRTLIDNPEGMFGSEFVHVAGIPRGTIYTLLGRMEEGELVKSTLVPASPAFNLPRQRYTITALGRRVYQNFLDQQGLAMVPFKKESRR